MKQHIIPSPFQGEGQGEGVHPRNLTLTKSAKSLRRRMTPTEQTLWYHLRNRRFEGFKFRRQYPIGRYVVDFICTEARLIIELDGSQHADSKKDKIRDKWLVSQDYRVFRFWNHDVTSNLEGVLEVIRQALNPHPTLSLKGRGKDKHSVDFERRDV